MSNHLQTNEALQARINALIALGEMMLQDNEQRAEILRLAEVHNGWFTVKNSIQMIENIGQQWLNAIALNQFIAPYKNNLLKNEKTLNVGLVLAGNVPMVGFHDVLCVYLTGYNALVKLSEKDTILMRWIIQFLNNYKKDNPQLNLPTIEIVERLNASMQAVIATGSDNSALYFEQYFAKYPNIIRKNRNSIAILNGQETKADLVDLGIDIFSYFGLGCRSVSKVFVPENYDFIPLMEQLDLYKEIANHVKYCNNYDYNRSIYLVNKIPHLVNDCIMVLESESLLSRIATLHYEFYKDEADLVEKITAQLPNLQCAVASENTITTLKSKDNLSTLAIVPFSKSQNTMLWDYADNVDTMQFLLNA